MRAIAFLLRLALPPSIKNYSQDADGFAARSVHDAKETAVSLRDAAECAKHSQSSGIRLKRMRLADSCLNPSSFVLALDQHFLGMVRKYEAKVCHCSDPKIFELR